LPTPHPRHLGGLIVFASLTALGAVALLAYDTKVALDSNPNVLLVGLPGRPYPLMFVALPAGLLWALALAACLLRLRTGWRLPLNWLGTASAIAYLGTLAALLH
jgi:hypothetical protein